MRADQAAKASADGYLEITMMHEICHGLGPDFARVNDKQVDIRESIGPVYGALEEAKADVTGMFATKWLVDKGALPANRLAEFYASYLAGILRSVRFGVAEAHGRAEMMEFNYLVEQGAIRVDKGMDRVHGRRTMHWRYMVDENKMPGAIASLARELLEIEATGDRHRAEAWFARYDQMPIELKIALDHVTDVPVDIYPVTPFPETVQ